MMEFFKDCKLNHAAKRLPFMNSALFPTVVPAVFAMFLLVIGPYIIQKYQLGDQRIKFIVAIFWYYEIMTNLNLLIAIVLAGLMFQFHFNWLCHPVEYEDEPLVDIVTLWMWMFMMVKVAELLEIFVWFSKNELGRVTAVMLFHHVTTTVIAWVAVKVVPAGTAVLLALLNSIAHIAMYYYYLMRTIQQSTSFLRRLAKSFVIGHLVISIVICGTVIYENCGFPLSLAYVLLGYMLIITVGTTYDYLTR